MSEALATQVSSSAVPLVFRNRRFGALWFAQVLAQGGRRLNTIAFLWWLLDSHQKDPGLWSGAFALCMALPSVILIRPIGSLVDRNRTKPVLWGADFVAGLFVLLQAILLYREGLTPVALLVTGFLVAACTAVFEPTFMKGIPEIVEARDVEPAIAFAASTQSLASFFGAVMGAVLIAKIGILGATLLNAVSFFVAAGVSACLTFRPPLSVVPNPGPAGGAAPLSEHLSFSMLNREDPFVARLVAIFAGLNFFISPVLILLPHYVSRVLSADASALANLEAGLWLGMLAGTFLAGRVLRGTKLVLALRFLMVGFGVCYLPLGWTKNQLIAGTALCFAGALLSILNVKLIQFFQGRVAHERKGRFFALLTGMSGATFPISFLLFGFLLDRMAPSPLFIVCGAGILVLSIPLFFVSAKEVP